MPMLMRPRVTPGRFPSIWRARDHFRPVKCRASMNGSLDGDGEICTIADVSYTNIPEGLTRLEVEEFNGLLHSIAWVLKGVAYPHPNSAPFTEPVYCFHINFEPFPDPENSANLGRMPRMDVRVQEAELSSDEDGVVTDVFMLTTLQGTALPDDRAREVVERVRDFVMYCGAQALKPAVEWRAGDVAISNQNSDFTLITIMDVENRVGFLLEVVSVLSEISMKVNAAKVRTCMECSSDEGVLGMLPEDMKTMISGDMRGKQNMRVMQFSVSELSGGKLTEHSVQAVLFTLGLVTGRGRTDSTTVPTLRSYATQFAD